MASRFRWPVLVAVAGLLALPACSGDDEDGALDRRLGDLAGAGVFVGGVAFTNTLVAIHFDGARGEPSRMRVFVADGLPGGTAEWFEGRPDGAAFRFTSARGTATIEGRIEPFETAGSVRLADGVERVFFTRPAGDGAGIFDVTIDAAGMWTGTSIDGSTLEAEQQGVTVEGFVRSAPGNIYKWRHNDLTRRLGYSRPGGAPDRYTVIATRQGTELVGRVATCGPVDPVTTSSPSTWLRPTRCRRACTTDGWP